jgi:hypothetical protein
MSDSAQTLFGTAWEGRVETATAPLDKLAQYSFQFQLPPICPPSGVFKGSGHDYCCVSYVIEALLDSPSFDILDRLSVVAFDVGGYNLPLDIVSRYLHTRLGCHRFEAKQFGRQESLSLEVFLHKRGYLKGEMVSADVTIENQSSGHVHGVHVFLLSHVMIKRDEICSNSTTVELLNDCEIEAWPFSCRKESLSFEIPRITLTSCQDDVVECAFELVFEIAYRHDSPRSTVNVRFPIVILRPNPGGAAPLQEILSSKHLDAMKSTTTVASGEVERAPQGLAIEKLRLADGSSFEVCATCLLSLF